MALELTDWPGVVDSIHVACVINEGNTEFGNKIPSVSRCLSFSFSVLFFVFDRGGLAIRRDCFLFFFGCCCCFQVAEEIELFGFGHNARLFGFGSLFAAQCNR